MRFRNSCQIFLGLFLVSQLIIGVDLLYSKDQAFDLQRKVEHLIEKILTVIENYYQEIKTQIKCIPDEIPDKIVNILKSTIDCADVNEKNKFNISVKDHRKNFHACFSKAKKQIEETMASINSTVEHCPENVTEKTYQIKVTTLYTKVFNINIKNGLEMYKKEIQTRGKGRLCRKNERKNFRRYNYDTYSSWEDENYNTDLDEDYLNSEELEFIYNDEDDTSAAYHKLMKSLKDDTRDAGEVSKFSEPKIINLNEKTDPSLKKKEDTVKKSKLSYVRTELPDHILQRFYGN